MLKNGPVEVLVLSGGLVRVSGQPVIPLVPAQRAGWEAAKAGVKMPSEKDRLPIGSLLVPFCGWYLGSYNVVPKRNY